MKYLLGVTLLLAVLLLPAPTHGQLIQQATLLSSDIEIWDGFGVSVSISGDLAIVGAHQESTAVLRSGAAYIFERDGGGAWNEVVKLQPGDPKEEGNFGFTVSISGDRAISSDQDVLGTLGFLYIFERNGSGTWSEVSKLSIDYNNCSGGISLSGDRIIVAGRRDDSAYIYHFDGLAWVEEQKLTASDGAKNFGSPVSISGDRAIVGANEESIGGAAYVFERDGGGTWFEVAKLLASDAQWLDLFGSSVSISGDRVIIGAIFEDTGGEDAGAAYVFERDGGGVWSEVAKLLAGDIAAQDGFGTPVSIGDSWAIVGNREAALIHSAYVFERDGNGSWSETQKLPFGWSTFGLSVSISGDLAIVGSDRVVTGVGDTGTAYIFKNDNIVANAIDPEELPGQFALYPNYPNPFNPTTTLRFELPFAGEVRLTVNDMLGRELNILADGVFPAGEHAVRFEAGDLPSGVYLFRLRSGQVSRYIKGALIR